MFEPEHFVHVQVHLLPKPNLKVQGWRGLVGIGDNEKAHHPSTSSPHLTPHTTH